MAIGEHGNISARKLKERTDATPEVWRAQAWERGRDGKSRVVAAQGRTKTLANRALQAKLKQKQGGDVAERQLPGRRPRRTLVCHPRQGSPGTMDNYRQQIDAHIKPMLRQVRLAEITTGRVEDFLAEVMKPRQVKMVRTNGRPMTVQRGGPHAAKACRVVLSLMFGMAVRHDAIDTNPVRESERPALPKTTIRALTLDEVNRLRENVAQWQDSDGHKGELLVPRWEDLDLHATPPTRPSPGPYAGRAAPAFTGSRSRSPSMGSVSYRCPALPSLCWRSGSWRTIRRRIRWAWSSHRGGAPSWIR